MIADIVTKLQAPQAASPQTAGFVQVLRPDAVGVTTINSGVVVADLISTRVGGRIYQLLTPERATLPNATFQLVSSSRDTVDGLPIIRVDKVLLVVRDQTLSALDTVIQNIESDLLGYTVSSSAGAITIDDQATDVEQVGNVQQYRQHMELTVTHLATSSQALPAAFVYPLSTASTSGVLLNADRTEVIDEAAVVIVEKSTSGSLDTAISYTDELIGHTVNGWPIRYAGGELVRQDGHLTTWRERFTLQSFRATT